MLGGKDFRRGQERTLIPGIDHLQHREYRDDGLAGPDLTLQHPIHRPTRRQLSGQHLEDILLTFGQFERHLIAHRRDQTVVRRGCDGAGLAQLAESPLRQRPLQTDGLVIGQTCDRGIAFRRLFRGVDRAQCFVLADQIVFPQKRIRQWFVDRVQHVE